MNEYKDICESELIFYEEAKKDGLLGSFVFSFGKSDTQNKNNRTYPHEVFSKAVNELNGRLIGNRVVGSLDHPLVGGYTRLGDASHILTKVWQDKDRVAWGQCELLDTSRGRDILKLVQAGVPVGASLRGFGEVDGHGRVKPGLEIKTVDLVCNPSFGDLAKVQNVQVFESMDMEQESRTMRRLEESQAGVGREAIYMEREPQEKKPERDKTYLEEDSLAGFHREE